MVFEDDLTNVMKEDDHELCTVQSLLQDYKRIISNHGHNSIVKSSYLKEIFIKEFGEERFEDSMNASKRM